jgi:NADH:ubiquinone oxidoreductase subunit 5 (subunit L)/multisubunit Na+/H+ antiporter MnhA subunit
MSGVMTKVAVYGFIRVAFELLRAPMWWTGALLLFLGGVTAALGVISALMQRDIKRLLAFSTVENIGMVFIGLGLALSFRANGFHAAAALALTAALFHVFNHSLFKSLLFFGAGAVQSATNERDMEKLGGLIHRMPGTSALFLVGSMAIAALPPLNGFVSEWLTFQAIVQSPGMEQWLLRIMIPGVGGLLALSAALAGACFVRAFGMTFLGRPRSGAADAARETDRFSLYSMGFLAVLCLAAGVLPGFVIDAIAPVTHSLAGDHLPEQLASKWLTLVPITESRSSYNGLLLFLYLVASAAVTAYLIRRLSLHETRRAPAWDCGYPEPSPATQYTATSFAQPFRAVFGSLVFRVKVSVQMPPPGDSTAALYSATTEDRIWSIVYEPLTRFVYAVANWMNRMQFLTIRRYLSLVFLALVALLLAMALWG